MNQVTTTQRPPASIDQIIERAATMPEFDIDKFQRLLDTREAEATRAADRAFTAAHTAAEAEMETIRADANNPQTRSKYASFAKLDAAARPIYTKHGFSISFTTEPMSTPDSILVVGMLSHRQGHSRRFQVPVPISNTGIKGQAMMTPVHAIMSAVSYGKRNLETMMFNLQVGDVDDDGNQAGGGSGTRRPPPQTGNAKPSPKPFEPPIDPATGEVIDTPRAIPMGPGDHKPWAEKFIGVLNNLAQSIDEQDRWIELNNDNLEILQKEKPPWFEAFMRAIGTAKEKYLDPQ